MFEYLSQNNYIVALVRERQGSITEATGDNFNASLEAEIVPEDLTKANWGGPSYRWGTP